MTVHAKLQFIEKYSKRSLNWAPKTKNMGLERWLKGLKALAALAEDLGLAPSTHMAADSSMQLQFKSIQCPLLAFKDTTDMIDKQNMQAKHSINNDKKLRILRKYTEKNGRVNK